MSKLQLLRAISKLHLLKALNERYHQQKERVLKLAENLEPEIYLQIKTIYEANSKDELEILQQELFDV